MTNPDLLTTLEDLERHYDSPSSASRKKISDHLTQAMQQWLSASPFFVLGTYSEQGLDCSPRGDPPDQAFCILDDTTLAIPDRRGNRRIDTLRNLITDPRVGLIFLIPGIEETLRIKGTASISINSALLQRFVTASEPAPATVILIHVQSVYLQNARAINRAGLWNPESFRDVATVPDAAELLLGAQPDKQP